MRDFEDPVHGPWWYVSPSRFLRRVLVIAVAIALIAIGITEWLKHAWENAPTRHPDGSIEYRHRPR